MFLLNTILAWNINIIMNKKYDNNNIIIASWAYFLQILTSHDHPILVATQDLPPQKSGDVCEYYGSFSGSADTAWLWPIQHLLLHLVHRHHPEVLH
jgi:hypothetical protein